MQFKAIIDKQGRVTTEVLDREGQNCSDILRVTNSLGRQMSDEQTGPDADTVHEVVR